MKSRKIIAVSVENYGRLRRFGYAGQSINQALDKLLAIAAGEMSD